MTEPNMFFYNLMDVMESSASPSSGSSEESSDGEISGCVATFVAQLANNTAETASKTKSRKSLFGKAVSNYTDIEVPT